jgi:hypothetical protein
MRMLSVALALALLLSGCSPNGTPAIPVPEPTSAPVFASDEDALAAAKVALAAYIAVSDAISQDGGANPERIAEVVTPEWLPTELNSWRAFQRRGEKLVGSTSIKKVKLEQTSDAGTVVVYACIDFTASTMIDKTGIDVGRKGPDDGTLEITFEIAKSVDLLLADSELWSGESIC